MLKVTVPPPVQILGRYHGRPTGNLTLLARDAAGEAWSAEVSPLASDSPAVTHVWARGQVRALEDRYAMGGTEVRALERRIVATSLRFGVLCFSVSLAAAIAFAKAGIAPQLRWLLAVPFFLAVVGVSESLLRFGTALTCEERGGSFFYRCAR